MHIFPPTLRKVFPASVHSHSVAALVLAAAFAAHAGAQIVKVANAASFSSTTVAPGSIISIFGSNLATGVAVTPSSLNPPLTLGGASVTVGGTPAGMFFV